MNEFVNYKKRSIDLPSGCKNLHDVLQSPKQPHIQHFKAHTQPFKVTREESGARTLLEIGNFAELALESSARTFTLGIDSPDERLTLSVRRVGGDLSASATIEEGLAQEIALRGFFAGRGLDMPKHSGAPPMFPSLPVYLIFNISPMPSQGSALSKLITDLLREVLGANEDTKLRFHYLEFTDAD